MSLLSIYRLAVCGMVLAAWIVYPAHADSADGAPELYAQIAATAPEHRVLNSGQSSLRSLYLPVHKGLVRLGVQPGLQHNAVDMSDANAMQHHIALQEFVKRLDMDTWRHREMCVLKDYEEEFTVSNILIDRDKAPPSQLRSNSTLYTWDGLAPRVLTDYLAVGLLAPMVAKKYFCAPGAPCAADLVKGAGYSKGYRQTSELAKWGGNADEFSARRELRAFATDVLPKIKQWAKQINCDYYLVNRVEMGEYDPVKKGIAVNIVLIDRGAMDTGYRPRDPMLSHANDANSHQHETVASMTEAQADSIFKRLEAAQLAMLSEWQRTQMQKANAKLPGPKIAYATVKVRQYWHQAPSSPAALYFEVRDAKVELFADDRLTDKLLDVTMTTQPARK